MNTMNTGEHILVNANEAVARMAFKTNEVFPIYPITPASTMSELVEEWSAKQQRNIFGTIPLVHEMQSEAGAAGTMHGALQTGSLSSTFTASQGLLLMLPNMYKIAGELTPNVIHVATRSIATHALSIYSDHSDVMAVRTSGYAMLTSASVQEAMDFALISQAATLKSRIPFVHFFDGFRTSHETQKIFNISDDVILQMMNDDAIHNHRNRALNPENPVLRGTSQAADTFFQSREAINSYYEACPEVVEQSMNEFASLTGRRYKLFDYEGDFKAEKVIIAMASATDTISETVKYLNESGEKVGLIKVRLYRPFSKKHLVQALPKTCRKITVLDRTKEPGSAGEPLFLDSLQAITEAFQHNEISFLPTIVGGRYGLSSKEFTPSMVLSIFDNLDKDYPKSNFTVGINDDVSNTSLRVEKKLDLLQKNFQVLCYGYKNSEFQTQQDKFLRSFENEPTLRVQSFTEIDYKKSKSRNVHNLRISRGTIKAPYLIEKADFTICSDLDFLISDSVLERLKPNGILVIKSELAQNELWKALSTSIQIELQSKEILLFVFGGIVENLLGGFSKTNLLTEDFSFLSKSDDLIQVTTTVLTNSDYVEIDDEFSKTLLGALLAGKGNELPVSAFPVDGTYPTDTSKYLKNRNQGELPVWDPNSCTQCGLCSLACPQAAIRPKVFSDAFMPESFGFKHIKATELGTDFDLLNYTIQINASQCTSCNLCVDACDSEALEMNSSDGIIENVQSDWEYFETIPELDRNKIDSANIAQQQLQEPLFKYSLGEEGCGQAPYLKLLAQLFGDRMLVANATGASSIFGGALPTTPWTKNSAGRGPAWSNSLFEDNAEFGLGFQLSQKQKREQAENLLKSLTHEIGFDLTTRLLYAEQKTEAQIEGQRNSVKELRALLRSNNSIQARNLLACADSLVKKSIWIVGGDGWAYDIGYGGLDHVLASGENVNILVLDNEVYSNTGGQQSKATPKGASAKFAYGGKQEKKKDLGALAMHYEDVYVASVAVGANQQQTLNAFLEAESYDGPSLIIAYCHSPAHGMDIKSPGKHQSAAVASGHWSLYRHDPRRGDQGFDTFQMDSKAPDLEISEFFEMESRFEKTLQQSPELVHEIQEEIDRRTALHQHKFG